MSDNSDTNENKDEDVNKDVTEEVKDEVTEDVVEATTEEKKPAEYASSSYYAEEKKSGFGGLLPLIAIVGLIVVLGGALYYLLSGSDEPQSTETASEKLETTEEPGGLPKRHVAIDELMKAGSLPENVMGNADAPITIIEYSSMTCPHCAHFHKDTLPELKKKYIDTGKVRYILREFPLDNLAAAAFMLGRCAGPEKYFPLIDALYAQQQSWAYGEGDPTPRLFEATKLAGAGFTKESFEACLQRQDLLDGINWVRERAGTTFNVRSTPSFFVNGTRLSGAQDLEKFEEIMKPYLQASN